jgi:sugar phosphate isomerase/epimerase
MKYGVCGNHEIAGRAAQAGYDYFEDTVGGFLKPRESTEAFAARLEQVRQTGLSCPVVNVFVPADLKITGPAVDLHALEQYVKATCARAEEAGIDTIVLGSGGARRIPDGFDRARAWAQLVTFGRLTAQVAAQHHIMIVVEPLNLAECNVINSVGEGAALVHAVNHPALRLLADAYHMLKDHDPMQAIVEHGDLIMHAHIATAPNRLSPGAEPCDLLPFFNALVHSGYDGRISVEGKISYAVADLAAALAHMQALEAQARRGSRNDH